MVEVAKSTFLLLHPFTRRNNIEGNKTIGTLHFNVSGFTFKLCVHLPTLKSSR